MSRSFLPLLLQAALLLIAVPACSETTRPAESPYAARIVGAARAEAARGTRYIEEYHILKYPGGDVPEGTGVCTDLVVRALRAAGVDLQQCVHEDRKANPGVYPTHLWSYKKPDRNIDHRRCQNLVVWFLRFTRSLPISTDPDSLKKHWQPGDVVFYVRPGASHPWHVAIVSDKRDPDGMPRIIDGYPPATSENHRLDTFAPIHSHFRLESVPPRKR